MKNANTYYKLVKLADMFDDAEWANTLKNNEVEDGYTVCDDETVHEINSNELEQVYDVECYFFAGSMDSEERFYEMDWEVMQHCTTGEYYVHSTVEICM